MSFEDWQERISRARRAREEGLSTRAEKPSSFRQPVRPAPVKQIRLWPKPNVAPRSHE